jgi:hypothetical protein
VAKIVHKTQKSKTIVVAFGRFNPPTSGHQLLFNKVVETAAKMGADHAIGISQTQEPKKNPLSASRKLYWLQQLFPRVNFISKAKIQTPFDMMYVLAKKGYTHIIIVSGEDRAEGYDMIKKYIGHKDPEKRLNIKRLDVVSLKRDAKSRGASGMSASKMREAVAKGNLKAFTSGLPASGRETAKRLFDEIKKGMRVSMKEEYDFTDLFHSAAQRMLESDKKKRRPPTPGETDGFSKHNKKYPTPPCKIDEESQIDEDAGCPSNSRGAENTWVSVSRGRVQFYVGKASQPCQTFGDGTILSAIRYGEEVYCALKNGRTAIYVIKNGRMIYGPVRIV